MLLAADSAGSPTMGLVLELSLGLLAAPRNALQLSLV
jgi:hypothetical protein